MASLRADRALEKRLEGLGWGLLLVWVGAVLLTHLGWAIFLLGVGVLLLGLQATRRTQGLRFEAFWVVVGVLFLVGGVWDLFRVTVGLVPVLAIAGGLLLVVSAFTRRRLPPDASTPTPTE